MLKSTGNTIKQKFRVKYSQKKFFFYAEDFEKVKRHQTKAISDISSNTTEFLEKVKTDRFIGDTPIWHIPAMTLVFLPIDYFTFSLLISDVSKNKSPRAVVTGSKL